MTLQNRVTPEGEIVSVAARGSMMGNRGGCLHDEGRRLRRRRWVSRQWICCRLDFNGRQRVVMTPGRYTELFFLDEATALAAGHRPCFECRREDALDFAVRWSRNRGREGRATAAEMDTVLHAERLDAAGGKRVFMADAGGLGDGAMFRDRSGIWLAVGGQRRLWTPNGYGRLQPIDPRQAVEVLTPPCIIGVLNAGFRPQFHASAFDLG